MKRRSVAAGGVVVVLLGAGVTAGVVASSSNPPGASPRSAPRVLFATLDALSCPSSGRCTAVGHVLTIDKDAAAGDPDGDGQSTRTLIDVLGGGTWHQMTSPDEGRGGDALTGVSCPTTDRCVAVGTYRAAPFGEGASSAPPVHPLIEVLTAGRWVSVPGPPTPPDSSLVSVACPATTSCTAVGSTTMGSNAANPDQSPLIEALDGTTWSSAPVTEPPGTSTELKAVSCPVVSSCVAVGDTAPASDPTATRPLVEQLVDGSWQASSPTPGSLGGTLDAVTCSAPERCVAVGNAVTGPSSGSALIASLDATGWHVDPTALGQSGDISLAAVDCPAGGSCTVAGISLSSALRVLARVDSGGWHPLSGYDQNATIQALVCPPASACLVVGRSYVNGYGNTTTLVGPILGDTLSVGSAPA